MTCKKQFLKFVFTVTNPMQKSHTFRAENLELRPTVLRNHGYVYTHKKNHETWIFHRDREQRGLFYFTKDHSTTANKTIVLFGIFQHNENSKRFFGQAELPTTLHCLKNFCFKIIEFLHKKVTKLHL